MKFIAYIALVSLVLLGMDRLKYSVFVQVENTETAHEMDCCASHADCDEEDDAQDKYPCSPDCDCGCCFHVTAIYEHFAGLPAAKFQPVDFGGFSNYYQFEYFIPPFHPPRLA